MERISIGKRPAVFAAMSAVLLCSGLARGWQPPQESKEEWEVSGTVTDEKGVARKAIVIMSGPQVIRPSRTDGQGRYSFKGQVPGLYSVRVQKEDDSSEPKSRSLTLVNGLRLNGIDFRIPKGGVISGRVLDERRQPVEGVIVAAMVKSVRFGPRFEEKGGDRTNDLGEYRIPYLPDGIYFVAVRPKPSPVRKRPATSAKTQQKSYPPLTFYPAGRTLESASAVEVRSGEERQGIDLALERLPMRCVGLKIDGAVADPSKPSAAYLTMREWVGIAGPTAAEGALSAGEDYEICGLAAGEYRIQVSTYTKSPIKGIGYGGAVALVGKQDVDLGTVVILPARDLRGTVSVKDHRPGDPVPPGMQIRLLLRGRGLMASDTLNGAVQSSGSFAMDHVYVDDYGLRVDGLSEGYYVISASQEGRSVIDGGLRPGNGDLQITLGVDGGAVRGRVLAENAEVVPDATVFLIPKGGGTPMVAQSDQNGAYQFASGVPVGEYRLVALSGLYEQERRDPDAVAKFSSKGIDVSFGSQASRNIDLKVQSAR